MEALIPIAFREGNYSSISVGVPGSQIDITEPRIVTYQEFKNMGLKTAEECTLEDTSKVLIALCYVDMRAFMSKCEGDIDMTNFALIPYDYTTAFHNHKGDPAEKPSLYFGLRSVKVSHLPVTTKFPNTAVSNRTVYNRIEPICKALSKKYAKHLYFNRSPILNVSTLTDWCEVSLIEAITLEREQKEDKADLVLNTLTELSTKLGRDCFKALRILSGSPRMLEHFLANFDVTFLEVLSVRSGGERDSLDAPDLAVDVLVTCTDNVKLARVGVKKSLIYYVTTYNEKTEVINLEGQRTVNDMLCIYPIQDFTHLTRTREVRLRDPTRVGYRTVDNGGITERTPVHVELTVGFTPSISGENPRSAIN